MTSVDLSSSPWLIRILDRIPVPLPVMGTLISLAHFVSISLLGWALSPTLAGEILGWGSVYGLAGDIVHSVLVGYMMTAGYYGLREAVRDFLSLRPALSCDDVEFDDLLTRLRHVVRAPLYFWSAIALVWGFSTPLLDTSWAGVDTPPLGSAQMTSRQI